LDVHPVAGTNELAIPSSGNDGLPLFVVIAQARFNPLLDVDVFPNGQAKNTA
jgi:hypothetical protein